MIEAREAHTCARCRKDLTSLNEVHVVEGINFCSERCAIEHHIDETILNAKEIAKQWYSDCAEIVTPIDMGLIFEKRWTAYSSEGDVTTIFLSRYLDEECTETISTEVIGFYFGEPNEADTEEYSSSTKATF